MLYAPIYMLVRLAISLTVLRASSEAERDIEIFALRHQEGGDAPSGQEAGPAAGRPDDPGRFGPEIAAGAAALLYGTTPAPHRAQRREGPHAERGPS